MPKVYMMIGVPGSGKSTWINQNKKPNDVVVSTDDVIEREAERKGKTYSEVFDSVIKYATSKMNDDLTKAIKNNQDIIWDQTNIGAKARRGKLSRIPKNYEKIAVFFPTPDMDELNRRLANRPGKTIPAFVVKSMITNLEPPAREEGFDQIITVRS